MTWLFWLLTLNSVVNPWIYMFFNANLVEALWNACCVCGGNGMNLERRRRGIGETSRKTECETGDLDRENRRFRSSSAVTTEFATTPTITVESRARKNQLRAENK